MLLTQDVYTVPLGKHSLARGCWRDLHREARGSKGFVRGMVCKYLGNIRTHMVLTEWETRESLEAWEATEHQTHRPPGTMIGQEAPRLWELAVDSPGDAEGTYLLRGILQASEGRWDEFIGRRPHHDAAGISIGGIAFYRTYRYAGEPVAAADSNTAMVLGCRTGRDVYEAWVESDAATKLAASDPPGLYKAVSADLFEIVCETKA